MSFRLKGRAFLVTWSQIPFDDATIIQDVLGQVLLLFGLYGTPAFTRACIEQHQDGGYHVHAFVFYPTAIDRRLSNQWDFAGVHPNVKPKRTRPEQTAAISYCAKDGCFLDEGSEPEGSVAATGRSASDSLVPDIASALLEHSTYPGWLQFCYENSVPFGYASEFWKSSRAGAETLGPDSRSDGTISDERLRDMPFHPEEHRALVIVGSSGCGKTTWVRRNAPQPALFVRHIDDLRCFRSDFHLSIVFDDMCFCGDRGLAAHKSNSFSRL
ncbi:hypothetical protein DFS34DRAFT_499336 [Phlyctochytrium arcticum]|nr:hypothetical protein DFS34DRAFT_499336 [Phlyctochytrium arcticum]